MDYLKPKGVMILIEAEHMCMTMRGVKKPGSKTVTVATRGALKRTPRCRKPFIICWSVRAYLKFAPQPVGEREERYGQGQQDTAQSEVQGMCGKNRKYEEERIFCRHDMSHFLDVARLSWIENLERGLEIEKELILRGGVAA